MGKVESVVVAAAVGRFVASNRGWPPCLGATHQRGRLGIVGELLSVLYADVDR